MGIFPKKEVTASRAKTTYMVKDVFTPAIVQTIKCKFKNVLTSDSVTYLGFFIFSMDNELGTFS